MIEKMQIIVDDMTKEFGLPETKLILHCVSEGEVGTASSLPVANVEVILEMVLEKIKDEQGEKLVH